MLKYVDEGVNFATGGYFDKFRVSLGRSNSEYVSIAVGSKWVIAATSYKDDLACGNPNVKGKFYLKSWVSGWTYGEARPSDDL